MRVARLLLSLIGLISFSLRAQSQVATPPSAQKDPQALAVLNSTLNAVGGQVAVATVADYRGAGNVTYQWDGGVQGSVTVEALGLADIRIDASLPKGIRSWEIYGGQTIIKAEDGSISQFPPAEQAIPSSDAFPYRTPLFPTSLIVPYLQLATISVSSDFNVYDKGMVTLNGSTLHDIQAELLVGGKVSSTNFSRELERIDFFIDPTSSLVVMTQDIVPQHVVHQIQYSDYRSAGSLLVPFSITELMTGQQTWAIHLNQISFNSGLNESAFVIR
jgi:hypothetical protein